MDATERLRVVIASESKDELTAALDDPSPEVARAAIRRLVEIAGQDAAAELTARLLRADLSLVGDLAAALRKLGDSTAVDLAIDGLAAESYTRRLAAAGALRVLRAPRAVVALRAALRDEIAGVRIAALDALADVAADADVAEDCARLLSDADAHVRIAAVRAVTSLAPRPGAKLAQTASDEDRLVRLEVARHVAGLPEDAARALLADPDLRVREAAAQNAGARELGQLAVLLSHDRGADVRRAAAGTLGSLGDPRIADVLVPGLEDTDAIVRAAVLRALERLLTRVGAVARLCNELHAGRSARRRASLYALMRLEAIEAADCVARAADDPDPDVRLAVVQTADVLLGDPRPVVRRLATDPDPAVSHGAEIWLLRHPGPSD